MPTSTARVPKRNKRELEKYRRLLEQKKAELSNELAKARSAEEESNEESTQDIADKAVSSYTREFLYSLTDAERTVVLQIDEALARIDLAAVSAPAKPKLTPIPTTHETWRTIRPSTWLGVPPIARRTAISCWRRATR